MHKVKSGKGLCTMNRGDEGLDRDNSILGNNTELSQSSFFFSSLESSSFDFDLYVILFYSFRILLLRFLF